MAGTRNLRITKCEQVYQGTNRNGGPFTIHEIEAADANTGVLVNVPLRSFDKLEVGTVGEFEVEKYERPGKPTTYTLKKPGGGKGGGNALGPKVDDLRNRMELVEGNLETMRANLANVQAMVERMAAGQPVAASAGPSLTGGGIGSVPPDDDIPF